MKQKLYNSSMKSIKKKKTTIIVYINNYEFLYVYLCIIDFN